MKEIRILGLRSLQDAKSIRLAPITVLLGENSSGKSTFLRTFPLLRQTVEVRTSEPLLWYGRLVDFGSFEESASKFNSEKIIEFEYLLDLDSSFLFSRHHYYTEEDTKTESCRVRYSVVQGPNDTATTDSPKTASYLKTLTLEICKTQIIAKFNSVPELCELSIDGSDFTQVANATFRVGLSLSLNPTIYTRRDSEVLPSANTINSELHSLVKTLVHARTKEESIDDLPMSLRLGTAEQMLSALKLQQQQRGLWKKEVLNWSINSPDFVKLRQLIWASRFEDLSDALAQEMRAEGSSISYITPLRAAAERYYRQQGLATNELDAKGENFALFLKSLNTRERESLRKWLSSALGVFVESDETRGHISLYLVDEKTRAKVNLADTGFGYSQLLPIAVQLWLAKSRKQTTFIYPGIPNKNPLIVIEQPELHLHPRIQAKVADLISHTISGTNQNLKSRIVIETHSEALVNRLGKLIATGTIAPDDINIILFHKTSFSEPTTVTTTTFDTNGFLQDWPLGFFNSD